MALAALPPVDELSSSGSERGEEPLPPALGRAPEPGPSGWAVPELRAAGRWRQEVGRICLIANAKDEEQPRAAR